MVSVANEINVVSSDAALNAGLVLAVFFSKAALEDLHPTTCEKRCVVFGNYVGVSRENGISILNKASIDRIYYASRVVISLSSYVGSFLKLIFSIIPQRKGIILTCS